MFFVKFKPEILGIFIVPTAKPINAHRANIIKPTILIPTVLHMKYVIPPIAIPIAVVISEWVENILNILVSPLRFFGI